MRTILASELKNIFLKSFKTLDKFSFEEGNPFLVTIKSRQYYIFLKNISPAYFKHSPDITRVQLPYSDGFLNAFKTNTPVFVLGYDIDNDIFICWDPRKVKERLNAKRNVSVYSRESLQKSVKANEFKEEFLTTGERIIAFKRKSLLSFFDELYNIFPSLDSRKNLAKKQRKLPELCIDETEDKIFILSDKKLINSLIPLLNKNKVLEAVGKCIKFYEGAFSKMTFKDWFKLVNQLYKEVNSN